MTFTRVIYAENTYDLEEEMNRVIADEENYDNVLLDIKFSSALQGAGLVSSERTVYTAILIFDEVEE